MWGDSACCCWLCRGREGTPANGCGQPPEAAKGKKSNPCGIPLQSSGYDLALSLLWAWVQSLVGELRSRRLHGSAKKKKKSYLQPPERKAALPRP